MSKFPLPLVAALTVGFAALAGVQTYRFTTEKSKSATLSARLNESEAKAAALEKEAAHLRDLNGIFQTESEQLRKKLAELSPGAVPGNDVAKASGQDAETSDPGAEGKPPGGGKAKAKGFMETLSKMFTDPEMKKAMRTQQAMGMRTLYGDLAKELGLSPDEAEQVLGLLTDRQVDMAGKGMELMGGASGDEAKQQAATKAINESRGEYDKQLEATLGKDRYEKFKEYEKTIGERALMGQIQQQFSARGMTLDDNQRQGLLNIMVEERLKAPPSPMDPGNRDIAAQMKAMKSDEATKAMLDQQARINARVLDRARTVLTPDQINALRESQIQTQQMQEFGIKMSKQMMQ